MTSFGKLRKIIWVDDKIWVMGGGDFFVQGPELFFAACQKPEIFYFFHLTIKTVAPG